MSVSKKLFVGVLVASALGAGAVPATAALKDCPSTKVCLFKDSNYVGLLGYRSGGQSTMNISYVNNDEMSSWSNKNSVYTAAWFSDAGGKGGCYQMNPTTNNHYVGYWYNDRASSWRTDRGC